MFKELFTETQISESNDSKYRKQIDKLNKKADDVYQDTSMTTPERMVKADEYLYEIKDIQRKFLKELLDDNFKSWDYDGKTKTLANIIVKGKKNGDKTVKRFIIKEQGIYNSKGTDIVVPFSNDAREVLAGVNYYTLEGH